MWIGKRMSISCLVERIVGRMKIFGSFKQSGPLGAGWTQDTAGSCGVLQKKCWVINQEYILKKEMPLFIHVTWGECVSFYQQQMLKYILPEIFASTTSINHSQFQSTLYHHARSLKCFSLFTILLHIFYTLLILVITVFYKTNKSVRLFSLCWGLCWMY